MQKPPTKYEYDQTVIVFGRVDDPETPKRRKKSEELVRKMRSKDLSKMLRDVWEGKIILTRISD